jgi:hypothetical protein
MLFCMDGLENSRVVLSRPVSLSVTDVVVCLCWIYLHYLSRPVSDALS